MIEVTYLPSFLRSRKKLALDQKGKVAGVIERFLIALKTGTRPQGLGLRKLRWNFWEIRIGLDHRLLFEMEKNHVTFIILGTHDDIARILKSC